MQERLESSTLGRVAVSVLVVVLLVAVVSANLPGSWLQQRLLRTDHHVVYGLGLDQNWNVFAPDPRRTVLYIEAKVSYEGGKTGVWRPPTGGALIGTYWDYRWRKWWEWTTTQNNEGLEKGAALYVAHQELDKHPLRVALIKRWYDLPPPGHVRDKPKWHEEEFYSLWVRDILLKENAT